MKKALLILLALSMLLVVMTGLTMGLWRRVSGGTELGVL